MIFKMCGTFLFALANESGDNILYKENVL